MYRFFVDPEDISEDEIIIRGEDVNHIRNVLRMKPGENVRLCTGEDSVEYRCEILSLDPQQIRTKILLAEETGAELPSRLVLFQGLPKSDKLELVIQKAVELGVYEVVPVETARSIVKLDAKKREARLKRWNAISESAAKQSKRLIIPRVHPLMTFDEALDYAESLDVKLIPYENAADMNHTREVLGAVRPGQSVGIFIGPEGGLEEEEVARAAARGASAITLGRRILRTETAGVAVLAALMFALEGRSEETDGSIL